MSKRSRLIACLGKAKHPSVEQDYPTVRRKASCTTKVVPAESPCPGNTVQEEAYLDFIKDCEEYDTNHNEVQRQPAGVQPAEDNFKTPRVSLCRDVQTTPIQADGFAPPRKRDKNQLPPFNNTTPSAESTPNETAVQANSTIAARRQLDYQTLPDSSDDVNLHYFDHNNECDQWKLPDDTELEMLLTDGDDEASRKAVRDFQETIENIVPQNELHDTQDESCDTSTAEPTATHTPRERATNSRKRTHNPSMWKRNIAKLAYNSGEEHHNQKGKLVPARQMGDPCSQYCRFKCHLRVSDADRRKFFEMFWGRKDHSKHLDFINQYVKVSIPKQIGKCLHANRKHTRTYFMRASGVETKVCQTMFLSSLAISDKMVRTAHDKLERNGVTISPDKRGKSPKQNEEMVKKMVASIDEHIKLFDVIPSHFCRKETKRKYLEPGLSINRLCIMYKNWMKESHPGDPVASDRRYRDHFNMKYNYGFFMPRKDQCELCNVYLRADEKLKAKLQKNFDMHIKHKDCARKKKNEDKQAALSDPKICFATFDLQKQLPTPKDETSVLYYKRKLSTYNFTVVDGAQKKAICFVWNESQGKRGANEVASCLEVFIVNRISGGVVTEFRFWSDNCFGQNKNKFVYALFTKLSHKYKVKITARYLETGHTQNECDTVHGRIEDAARGKTVYTSEQWYSLIQSAVTKAKPFEVIKMEGKFFDWHPLANMYQRWDGKGVNWKKVREVVFDPSEPQGVVSVRGSLDGEVQKLNISKKCQGRPVNISNFMPKKAYNGPITIKKNKLIDLTSLCDTNVIPQEYHEFYKSLSGVVENASEDDIVDDDDAGEEQWQLLGMEESDFDYSKWLSEQMKETSEENASDRQDMTGKSAEEEESDHENDI